MASKLEREGKMREKFRIKKIWSGNRVQLYWCVPFHLFAIKVYTDSVCLLRAVGMRSVDRLHLNFIKRAARLIRNKQSKFMLKNNNNNAVSSSWNASFILSAACWQRWLMVKRKEFSLCCSMSMYNKLKSKACANRKYSWGFVATQPCHQGPCSRKCRKELIKLNKHQ